MNLSFRSIFNNRFTNHGCLRCASVKTLYNFEVKRVHEAINLSCIMFKDNMKFTKAVCWTNWKVSKTNNNTTLIMFLRCQYWFSLLCYNYWSSLMLWSCTLYSCVKLTVQIQLALHSWDSYFTNNNNATAKSVEKRCFAKFNAKLKVEITFRTFYGIYILEF